MSDPETRAAENAAGVDDRTCPNCGADVRAHCACKNCGHDGDDQWARSDDLWERDKDDDVERNGR